MKQTEKRSEKRKRLLKILKEQPGALFTTEEVAIMAGVSVWQLYKWRAQGLITFPKPALVPRGRNRASARA